MDLKELTSKLIEAEKDELIRFRLECSIENEQYADVLNVLEDKIKLAKTWLYDNVNKSDAGDKQPILKEAAKRYYALRTLANAVTTKMMESEGGEATTFEEAKEILGGVEVDENYKEV